MQTINERFKSFIIIIFNQTFGILKYHNNGGKGRKGGAFSEYFGSANLGRDLKKIANEEPINPNIYISTINAFYNSNNPECIEKTIVLIEQLESEGYINGLDDTDIINKCDPNTIQIYRKILLNLWSFYYDQYQNHFDRNTVVECYSIPQEDVNIILKKYSEYRLPVNLKYYQKRLPDIIELIKTKPSEFFDKRGLETEYIYFFKNVLEQKSFYTLSLKDRKIFFNTLYAMSDILDKIHHKDSYIINLEILEFFNEIYNDNYHNINIDDICRIQGCIYAISIENTENSLQGNIRLTKNNNITCKKYGFKPITQQKKLELCDTALRSLLTNKHLNHLNQLLEYDIEISIYENRLKKKRPISPEEIYELSILSLIYSNIAICSLQYIKYNIDLPTKYDKYAEICEQYLNRSRYIRNLIIRITQKQYGEHSPEYKDALHFLATYYHSVATHYFYTKDYSNSIVIRSVLFTFYKTIGLNEKSHVQLDLAPISLYEQSGGNKNLYLSFAKSFFNARKKDFSYLFTKELMSYDDFKKLVEFKDLLDK